MLVMRVVPPGLRSARRPLRPIERSAMVYRRTWVLIVSGFFEPLLYLLSLRVGVGKLVGTVTLDGRVVSYASFVAPAMMASSAMNGAVYDSTMNVFHKLRYSKTYDAMLATPLNTADVALGEIGWALIRGMIYAVSFLGVLIAMGLAESPWVILSLPICTLIGLAFASVGMAGTTYMRSWADFEIVTLITMPIFLFSATFFPAASYGTVGHWLLQISPLYHGIVLIRAANIGQWTWTLPLHAAFLVAMTGIGMTITAKRLDKLLLK
jgi:lipooligosaccharide transport system permease protein